MIELLTVEKLSTYAGPWSVPIRSIFIHNFENSRMNWYEKTCEFLLPLQDQGRWHCQFRQNMALQTISGLKKRSQNWNGFKIWLKWTDFCVPYTRRNRHQRNSTKIVLWHFIVRIDKCNAYTPDFDRNLSDKVHWFSGCADKSTYCSAWATQGYCTGKHADYMTKNCMKSCQLCKKTTKPPTTVSGKESNALVLT